jgi:predicted dehydrogenase
VAREVDARELKVELKIGIIGAGWISPAHAEGWLALGDRVRVVGVADVNEAAARGLADRFEAQVYTDYRALIERGDLDAVDILVPPHLHVEMVSAAAGAGLHILCEKPLARDLEEAALIGEVLKRSGVIYMPAHNTLFYPSIQRCKAYLSKGDLGRLYFMRCLECYTDAPPERLGGQEPFAVDALKGDAWRASKELLKGGALIDGGYHAVYRLLFLADSEPIAVSALMGLYHPQLVWETEDSAVLLVRFASGLIGEVMISYAFEASLSGQDRTLLIAGREGLLAANEHSLYFKPAGWSAPAAQQLSPVQGDAVLFSSISAQIAHFAGCLLGQQTPIQAFQDALRAIRVVRAAYRSAETGETVRIET